MLQVERFPSGTCDSNLSPASSAWVCVALFSNQGATKKYKVQAKTTNAEAPPQHPSCHASPNQFGQTDSDGYVAEHLDAQSGTVRRCIPPCKNANDDILSYRCAHCEMMVSTKMGGVDFEYRCQSPLGRTSSQERPFYMVPCAGP